MSAVPADDPALRLVVAFVNTYDLLNDPPDRLTVHLTRDLLRRFGFPALATGLRTRDLDRLRELRAALYRAFAASTPASKARALNAILDTESAQARLVAQDEHIWLRATGGTDAASRLAVLLADSLGRVLAAGGADRLGTCVADPCRCGYLDRTRAGRQRYCCELCNDRVAAAAHRRRSASAPDRPTS